MAVLLIFDFLLFFFLLFFLILDELIPFGPSVDMGGPSVAGNFFGLDSSDSRHGRLAVLGGNSLLSTSVCTDLVVIQGSGICVEIGQFVLLGGLIGEHENFDYRCCLLGMVYL